MTSPTPTPADVIALAEELRAAAEGLHVPPSVQSQRNIRAMNAMDKAATALRASAGAYVEGQRSMQTRAKAVARSPRFADVTRVGTFKGPEWTEETGNAALCNSHARMIASAIASLPLQEAQESDGGGQT